MTIIEIEEVTIKTGVHLIIDYFSATFPFICYEDELELRVVEDIILMIGEFFNYSKEYITKCEYAQNRFMFQYIIGEHITLRLLGPELKSGYRSCNIEMKGQACREYENHSNKSWNEFLIYFLVKLNASPTRIDLAIDDYEGDIVDFKWLKNKLDLKQYITSFKKKYYKLIGCDEEGWTIQFGVHGSTQMLVIYEKDKEQQARDNICLQKYWVRYEMRFFQDKAYDIAFNLMDKDFKEYFFGILLNLLDIKKDNSDEDQCKVDRDDRWKEFTNNYDKVKMEKYKNNNPSYLSYMEWATKIVGFYIIMKMTSNGNDHEYTITEIYEEALIYLKSISERSINRLNHFRIQKAVPPISMKELEELKKQINRIVIERKLPF